ncbi:methyltransferase-like protein 22 isoform X1 [Bombyx mori]|uniref:Methyltransferase-like protein 22 n=1 Tax=Bombyx mori TaxID=7091 RepID=A0A8R2GAV0_BOMMO|nr:methyltransferase-like protein 22 [Bombyx mori]XP_012550544.1 methyltransferase-like protein 22 [Bombyx mori]XP_012550545.1 methyltransferase-like protein 22 [Bombyx mori]XP_021207146.1 methyltransferase-like protein 22 [Bombyx mori]
MPEYTVTSEIYEEYDYTSNITPSANGNVISEFPFLLPITGQTAKFDEDGDLDAVRPKRKVIRIEHSPKTAISLVGRQVWRGAFLLGDWLIHLGLKGELSNKNVLELGAGTGVTSIVAALFAEKVVCTDINVGGILDLINLNAKYNKDLIKSHFSVMPLDFTDTAWSSKLNNVIKEVDFIIAADVIYDDDVTAAFISTIQKILNLKPPKTVYVVLEKRYVFTIEHLDCVAPCYETFLTLLDKVKSENVHSTWTVEQLPLDFPKYFTYDRVKDLVLWKISSK